MNMTCMCHGKTLTNLSKKGNQDSGQIIIFHQPRFPWKKRNSRTKQAFGGPGCIRFAIKCDQKIKQKKLFLSKWPPPFFQTFHPTPPKNRTSHNKKTQPSHHQHNPWDASVCTWHNLGHWNALEIHISCAAFPCENRRPFIWLPYIFLNAVANPYL